MLLLVDGLDKLTVVDSIYEWIFKQWIYATRCVVVCILNFGYVVPLRVGKTRYDFI